MINGRCFADSSNMSSLPFSRGDVIDTNHPLARAFASFTEAATSGPLSAG